VEIVESTIEDVTTSIDQSDISDLKSQFPF